MIKDKTNVLIIASEVSLERKNTEYWSSLYNGLKKNPKMTQELDIEVTYIGYFFFFNIKTD